MDAIMINKIGGESNEIGGDFIKNKKITVTVGENSITNVIGLRDYLASFIPEAYSKFLSATIHKKESYLYNCIGILQNTIPTHVEVYRYRGGWSYIPSADAAYDAIATVGDVYDVFYAIMIEPN